jgi:folate-binding protein YgfZ
MLAIAPDALTAAQEQACVQGAAHASADAYVVRLEGPATVACVQGLLTNDVEAPGDGSIVYGAVLTPKGMILTDLWTLRTDPAMTLIAPPAGAASLGDILARYVPPRLARATDATADLGVVHVLGAQALEAAGAAGLPVPDAGRVTHGELDGVGCAVARPPDGMPFALVCLTPEPDALRATLTAAGALDVPSVALDFARIVCGWPAVGYEIGEKTLPQEVRFDELGGVSYSKGCYTGQETVARLHFRGHANRRVVGLTWAPDAVPADASITADDRSVGRLTSAAWAHTLDRPIGLGILRREVEEGARVTAGGVEAIVCPLPLDDFTS